LFNPAVFDLKCCEFIASIARYHVQAGVTLVGVGEHPIVPTGSAIPDTLYSIHMECGVVVLPKIQEHFHEVISPHGNVYKLVFNLYWPSLRSMHVRQNGVHFSGFGGTIEKKVILPVVYEDDVYEMDNRRIPVARYNWCRDPDVDYLDMDDRPFPGGY